MLGLVYSPSSIKVKDEVDADMITIAGVKLLESYHNSMTFRTPNAAIEGRGEHDMMEEAAKADKKLVRENMGFLIPWQVIKSKHKFIQAERFYEAQPSAEIYQYCCILAYQCITIYH